MGLEPMTSSLPRKCSTTELQQPAVGSAPRSQAPQPSPDAFSRRRAARPVESLQRESGDRSESRVERAAGIEPALSAWKAEVLPLNYARSGVQFPPAAPPGVHGRCSPQAALALHKTRSARRTKQNELHRGKDPERARIRRGRGSEEGMVGGAGFEPAKAWPSDLQSDPFGRSGIPPWTPVRGAEGSRRPPPGVVRAPDVRCRRNRARRRPLGRRVVGCSHP